MGKRSAIATTEAEAAALTLSELNQRIASMQFGVDRDLSAWLRRSAFKRLVWLEEQRKRLHGVAAPKRRF
jgi:hypothetical protein